MSSQVTFIHALGSSARLSPTLHEKYVRELGRNVRIRGVHPVRRYILFYAARQVTNHFSVGTPIPPTGPGHVSSRVEKPHNL